MSDLITCNLCGGKPKTKSAYEAHIKTKKHLINEGVKFEPNEKFRCEKCDKSYCTEKALEIHYLTQKHKDAVNGKVKKKKGPIGRPIGLVLEKTIRCKKCDKMFSSKYHLRRHKGSPQCSA